MEEGLTVQPIILQYSNTPFLHKVKQSLHTGLHHFNKLVFPRRNHGWEKLKARWIWFWKKPNTFPRVLEKDEKWHLEAQAMTSAVEQKIDQEKDRLVGRR